MPTLVVRLAGPLQSWGETAPFLIRSSLPYPTYSGLLGMCRAALGYGRDDDPAESAWLADLSMTLRIDRPGSIMVDFHTVVAPPPSPDGTLRFTIPLGALNASGGAVPWRPKTGSAGTPTLVTKRHYLTDAQFTWFITGPKKALERLSAALTAPVWPLSLGRKSCVPDYPLVLGMTTHTSGIKAAATTPTTAHRLPVEVHVLTGPAPTGSVARAHNDKPKGSHPQDGYTRNTRHVTTVAPPLVTNRNELIAWAIENLQQGES